MNSKTTKENFEYKSTHEKTDLLYSFISTIYNFSMRRFDYRRFKFVNRPKREIRETLERNEKNVCLFISKYFRQRFPISARCLASVGDVCFRRLLNISQLFHGVSYLHTV